MEAEALTARALHRRGQDTRLASSEILDDEEAATCADFSPEPSIDFAGQGIGRIAEVMTDDHWSDTRSTELARQLVDLGAEH